MKTCHLHVHLHDCKARTCMRLVFMSVGFGVRRVTICGIAITLNSASQDVVHVLEAVQ